MTEGDAARMLEADWVRARALSLLQEPVPCRPPLAA